VAFRGGDVFDLGGVTVDFSGALGLIHFAALS
jgi:hypothetical protein